MTWKPPLLPDHYAAGESQKSMIYSYLLFLWYVRLDRNGVCLWYDQWHKTMVRQGKSSDEKRSHSGTSCQRIDTGKHGMYFWPKSICLHERILWSIDGRCYLLCVGWQVRGEGGSVRAVKPIDEIVTRHFPGDFIVNWLFFSVCI